MGGKVEIDPKQAIAYLKGLVKSDDPSLVVPDQEAPVFSPFAPDVGIAYLIDVGDSLRYVQYRHLGQASMSVSQLHDCALANLSALAEAKLEVHRHGSVFALLLDGNFNASILLVDQLWEGRLKAFAPSGFVAAIPARDILVFANASDSAGIAELREIVERVSDGGDHLLTQSLYTRRGSQWVSYAA